MGQEVELGLRPHRRVYLGADPAGDVDCGDADSSGRGVDEYSLPLAKASLLYKASHDSDVWH